MAKSRASRKAAYKKKKMVHHHAKLQRQQESEAQSEGTGRSALIYCKKYIDIADSVGAGDRAPLVSQPELKHASESELAPFSTTQSHICHWASLSFTILSVLYLDPSDPKFSSTPSSFFDSTSTTSPHSPLMESEENYPSPSEVSKPIMNIAKNLDFTDLKENCINILQKCVSQFNSQLQDSEEELLSRHLLLLSIQKIILTDSDDVMDKIIIAVYKAASGYSSGRLTGDYMREEYRLVLSNLLQVGARHCGGSESTGFKFFVAIICLDVFMSELSILSLEQPRQNLFFKDEGGQHWKLDSRALPYFMPHRTHSDATHRFLEQLQMNITKIKQNFDFGFTVVEYGYSKSSCIPIGVVWTEQQELPLRDILESMELELPVVIRNYSVCGSASVASSSGGSFPPLPPPSPPLSTGVIRHPVPTKTNRHANRDTALDLIYGNADTTFEKSRILSKLAAISQPTVNKAYKPLIHASNISSLGSLDRGSACVFLEEKGAETATCLFLTAAHVLADGIGSSIQQISHLDVVMSLASTIRNSDDPEVDDTICGSVLRRVQPVGRLVARDIGVAGDGWRVDWALASINEGFEGINGQFHSEEGAFDLEQLLGTEIAAATSGIHSQDANSGDSVFKAGTTTGYSCGEVSATDLFWYEAATAQISEKETGTGCRLQIIFPASFGSRFCARGDAGAGVFSICDNKFSWAGMLVGMEHNLPQGSEAGRIDHIGLMIPQSAVINQIQASTGKRWTLKC
ncbi:hypothetical protein EDC01DRAFT_632859 [Geopyxis carbonaria]|nr:hypothetical protein EDC01DRAFT_632859 [Geopyxis carbonaria]